MTRPMIFLRAPALLFLVLSGVLWCVAAFNAESPQNGRTSSPHGAIKIACQNCHITEGWRTLRPSPDFNHRATGFPIQGKHVRLSCNECHVNLVFSKVGTECDECHADIHRRQMGTNCEECHSVRGWLQIKQETNGHENRFPLWGAHAMVQCEGCHKNAAVGLYRGLSTDCASCHSSDFRSAKNPDHLSAGYSLRCETCHSSDSWISGFDHGHLTGFPLVGAHAQLDCMQCHAGGVFIGTPAACVDCHLQDFNNATNPNHISSGFSQNCSVCHNMTSWIPATYNHNVTAFPLTGAHKTASCTSCHVSGIYAGTPTDCYSCHQQDYNGATNPNHVSAGFPRDCSVCHSTIAFTPSTFNHSKTTFPLTGAHTSVACTSCHVSGIYAGTPTDCYSCHSSEYNSTTDPNHAAAAMPKTCADCHTTTTWSGAVFTHSRFPIYSGSHAGRWTTCTDCHTNSSDYSVFTCTTACHPKSTMDSRHRGVSNYVYNSANCYSCHPTGRSD